MKFSILQCWNWQKKMLYTYGLMFFLTNIWHFFRMRAKTSEFLKVLNRAKISEDTGKKKVSYMGKTPFGWEE